MEKGAIDGIKMKHSSKEIKSIDGKRSELFTHKKRIVSHVVLTKEYKRVACS